MYKNNEGKKVNTNGNNRLLKLEKKNKFVLLNLDILKRLNKGKKPIKIINIYLIKYDGCIIATCLLINSDKEFSDWFPTKEHDI